MEANVFPQKVQDGVLSLEGDSSPFMRRLDGDAFSANPAVAARIHERYAKKLNLKISLRYYTNRNAIFGNPRLV